MTAGTHPTNPTQGTPHCSLVAAGDPRQEVALALALTGEATITPEVRRQIDALSDASRRQGLTIHVFAQCFGVNAPSLGAIAIESPGHSAMVQTRLAHDDRELARSLTELLMVLSDALAARGVLVLQAMISPEESALATIFRDGGLHFLTDLLYMDGATQHFAGGRRMPRGVTLATYAPARHQLFIRALESTYVDSLDCPGLTGLRKTEDVLAGHRATGIFDPNGWYVARLGEDHVGVLLTAEVVHRDALEIVYIGVSAAHRGQGVGNLLMHTAHERARALALPRVTLAVDATNEPARHLYAGWGYHVTQRRRVWIKHLAAVKHGAW